MVKRLFQKLSKNRKKNLKELWKNLQKNWQKTAIRGLSQITFAFFGIFWPRTPLVCTFYVVNYTFFWPPTHPKCKRNLWKFPYDDSFEYCVHPKKSLCVSLASRITFFQRVPDLNWYYFSFIKMRDPSIKFLKPWKPILICCEMNIDWKCSKIGCDSK